MTTNTAAPKRSESMLHRSRIDEPEDSVPSGAAVTGLRNALLIVVPIWILIAIILTYVL